MNGVTWVILCSLAFDFRPPVYLPVIADVGPVKICMNTCEMVNETRVMGNLISRTYTNQ